MLTIVQRNLIDSVKTGRIVKMQPEELVKALHENEYEVLRKALSTLETLNNSVIAQWWGYLPDNYKQEIIKDHFEIISALVTKYSITIPLYASTKDVFHAINSKKDYELFRWTATEGHSEVIKIFLELVKNEQKEKQQMLSAKNYQAVVGAIIDNHIDTAKLLWKELPAESKCLMLQAVHKQLEFGPPELAEDMIDQFNDLIDKTVNKQIDVLEQLLSLVEKAQVAQADYVSKNAEKDSYEAKVEVISTKDSTLHEVVLSNDLDKIDDLITKQKADINNQDISGLTPIMLAVKQNNLKAVEKLLTYNPDLSIGDFFTGNTAAHIAAQTNNLEMLKKLEEKSPAIINTLNHFKSSLLHSAAYGIMSNKEDWGVIKWLLSKGAKPVEDESGTSVSDVLFEGSPTYAQQFDTLIAGESVGHD